MFDTQPIDGTMEDALHKVALQMRIMHLSSMRFVYM